MALTERLSYVGEDLGKLLLWVEKEKVMDWFSPVDLYSPIQASNPKLNSAAPSNGPVSEFRSTSGNDSINSISAAKILKLFELHKDFEKIAHVPFWNTWGMRIRKESWI